MDNRDGSAVLHMIGNAHIDPVWLWPWQEGFHEVKATFRSALDRMNEYDDFVFVSSSAAFYEWVEHSDPAMFEEIRQRVAQGRWQIVGGWWIQPDCNIPGGESFARQALYGQHYFQEKFGVTACTGYNVDSFGHSGMLPQILSKSGLKYYTFLRPQPHEKNLPGRLFWWESDDGSRVLAFRIPYEYGTWGKDLEHHIRNCARELPASGGALMCFYGVGNHGGGPTRENIESIQRLAADPTLPTLLFSTPDRFFASVLAGPQDIPVVHDELQHHASGCYAAHSGIKRWNRQAENRLLAAEKFSVLARWITGQPYPSDLPLAWKDVLFNQFHDILAGTSLESAYEDARNQYGEAISIADRALNYAVQSLAWNIDIAPEEGMTPVIVFNPHAWAARLPVEFQFRGLSNGPFALLDDRGQEIPVQMIPSHAAAGGQVRLLFVADLPALGYRTYRIVRRMSTLAEGEPLHSGDWTLENRRFRLEINPATGCIGRLYDKQQQVEVFLGDAARAVVVDDPSDTWSHQVFQFQQVVGSFTPTRVALVESGPVRATLRVWSSYGRSTLTQDFTLYRDLDPIEVAVSVDWHEQFKALKLRFLLGLNHVRATYEIPFGHQERPTTGTEEPGQSWVDVTGVSRESGTPYGLSLLNDGKYSFDVHFRDIGLTVLRSPIYAHHEPLIPDPAQSYTFMDQGLQRFTVALLPHTESWREAHTVRRAAELNQRPTVLLGTYHRGDLPQSDSYLSVDRDNIVISAVKQAEEGEDMVIRCYETDRVATEALIFLPRWNRVIQAAFGPCEIKTFRVPRDPALPVREVNLLEWSESGPDQAADHAAEAGRGRRNGNPEPASLES